MPKHPGIQRRLSITEQIAKQPVCPVCGKRARLLVNAQAVTYFMHGPQRVCVTRAANGGPHG